MDNNYYQNLSGLYIGDFNDFSIPTGAVQDYVLTCLDSTGTAGWRNLSSLGVTSIQGTVDQVLVNGLTTPQTGDVILTLPQAIATTSSPTFVNISGTLLTAAQPNITSVGNLNNLTVSSGSTSLLGNTISSTQWSYLASLNQSLATTSSPTFVNISGTLLTAAQPNISSLSSLTSIQGVGGINATKVGYWVNMDQNVSTTSSPAFSNLYLNNGSEANPSYTFTSDNTSGMSYASGILKFSVSGSLCCLFNNVGLQLPGLGIYGLSNLNLAGDTFSICQESQPSTIWQYTKTINQPLATTSSPTFVNISGTLLTAAQPNISSLSSLTSIQGVGGINATKVGYWVNMDQNVNTTSNIRANNLAVGSTTTAGSGYTIDAQASSGECWVGGTGFGSGAPTRFLGRRAGGTQATPTATPNGVNLCILDGRGHTGTNWTGSIGNISIASTQTFTTSAQGTLMNFQTTSNGSTTPVTRLTINQDGTVVIAGNLSSINGTAISGTQWGYIGGLNQALTTSSNVTFGNIGGTLTTSNQPNITSLSSLTNIQGTSITSSTWPFLANINQNLSQTSNPIFNTTELTNGLITSNTTTSFGVLHHTLRNGATVRFSTGLIDTESGSNSGSNYSMWRNSDTGISLGRVLNINRSTGNITIDNTLTVTGSLTVSTLTNNTNGNITATTYTPTTSSLVNISSITITIAANYQRIGNIINVTGTIDPVLSNAASTCTFKMTLPISASSNFSSANLVQGGSLSKTSNISNIRITADTTTSNTANITMSNNNTNGSSLFVFSLSYSI